MHAVSHATPISPLAFEAVKRMDAIFEIEREINGKAAGQRLAVRAARSAPLFAELESWMRLERTKLSRHAPLAKALDYMLARWDGFTAFLHDGRCVVSPWAENHGCSPDQSAGRSAPPSCTPSSLPPR